MRPIQPYTKYPYKYLTAVHVVFPIFSLGTLQTLILRYHYLYKLNHSDFLLMIKLYVV